MKKKGAKRLGAVRIFFSLLFSLCGGFHLPGCSNLICDAASMLVHMFNVVKCLNR